MGFVGRLHPDRRTRHAARGRRTNRCRRHDRARGRPGRGDCSSSGVARSRRRSVLHSVHQLLCERRERTVGPRRGQTGVAERPRHQRSPAAPGGAGVRTNLDRSDQRVPAAGGRWLHRTARGCAGRWWVRRTVLHSAVERRRDDIDGRPSATGAYRTERAGGRRDRRRPPGGGGRILERHHLRHGRHELRRSGHRQRRGGVGRTDERRLRPGYPDADDRDLDHRRRWRFVGVGRCRWDTADRTRICRLGARARLLWAGQRSPDRYRRPSGVGAPQWRTSDRWPRPTRYQGGPRCGTSRGGRTPGLVDRGSG